MVKSLEPNDFSISQQWYAAGWDAARQAVEGGWQVNEQKYHTKKAVLFIYFTPSNYGSGSCYNKDCEGFIQINSHWYLGGTWDHYSVIDGAQWGFEMQWKMYEGNWWLFLKGPGSYEALGY